MSPEQDKYLCETYPILYRDRNASIQDSCMPWGFECGIGWFDIINDLSKVLEDINKKVTPEEYIIAAQVKEKFGGLRFYLCSYPCKYDKKVNKAIRKAEKLSYKTCEICGKPGKLGGSGWMSTQCEECRGDKNASSKN